MGPLIPSCQVVVPSDQFNASIKSSGLDIFSFAAIVSSYVEVGGEGGRASIGSPIIQLHVAKGYNRRGERASERNDDYLGFLEYLSLSLFLCLSVCLSVSGFNVPPSLSPPSWDGSDSSLFAFNTSARRLCGKKACQERDGWEESG